MTFWSGLKEYDQEGKLILDISYTRKGDIRKQNSYTYNKNGDLLTSLWIYRLDNEGQRTETVQYTMGGKLKHKWSYSCNDEGKLVDKDTTEVCILTEHNSDGSWAVVTIGNEKKGKTYNEIKRYDVDSNLVECSFS